MFLGITYGLAVAIALALPHAGIAPMISILVPVTAVALTVALTVPGYLLLRREADFERARPAPSPRAERPWHATPS